jgi:hypothetical protein
LSPPLLLRHAFVLALLALFTGPRAYAQCLSWSPEFAGTPLPDVFALASFDDGSGPAVYVASTSFVRRYDGAGWSVVGNGTGFLPGAGQTYTPSVLSRVVFDDGSGAKLYAGGRFESVDGVPAACLAKWDGAAWSSAGDPLNPALTSILTMTIADFGSGPRLFRANEGTQALDANVARFDGSVWTSIGSLAQGAIGFVRVTALAAHDDGGGPALYAGGTFASANGVPATNVARWDPALGTWSAVGAGLDNSVYALASHAGPSGPSLWAGGLFAQNLSVFDGSTWSVPAGGANGIVRAFAIADEGDGPALFAGGEFTQIGSVAASLVARRQGSTWVPLGGATFTPQRSAMPILSLLHEPRLLNFPKEKFR